MWREILQWCLDFISNIGDFASWLFTPININVVSKVSVDNLKQLNASGLSNFPTWVGDLLANASEPIYVTPISILSVSTITILIGVWLITHIVK